MKKIFCLVFLAIAGCGGTAINEVLPNGSKIVNNYSNDWYKIEFEGHLYLFKYNAWNSVRLMVRCD